MDVLESDPQLSTFWLLKAVDGLQVCQGDFWLARVITAEILNGMQCSSSSSAAAIVGVVVCRSGQQLHQLHDADQTRPKRGRGRVSRRKGAWRV